MFVFAFVFIFVFWEGKVLMYFKAVLKLARTSKINFFIFLNSC